MGRILVCGGAGFVGSHLAERLLDDGHEVDVVDDLTSGSLANLATARAHGGRFTFLNLDVSGDEFVDLVGHRRPDKIINLCTLAPARCTDEGAMESLALCVAVLEAARTVDIDKVVTTIPAKALYGESLARGGQIKEGQGGEPRSLVGIVARAIADVHTVYRDNHAIEFTVLATGHVYGVRQRPRDGVVSAFLEAHRTGRSPVLHGSGRQTRDFVHVDDVVDAISRALDRAGGLLVNVGTGRQTAIADLWTMIAGRRGLRPQIGEARPDDVSRLALSPVRARIQLGWTPRTGIADGISLTQRAFDADASAE